MTGVQTCALPIYDSFKNWDEYRNFLGRSLIYFNPTRQSPMPRSRTEAFLSGCCVITRDGQDVEDFVTDKENAIIVPRNPKAIADIIESLILDYKKAISIGNAGKDMAQKVFDIKRFQQDWLNVINLIKK